VGADSGYLFLKDEQKGALVSQASWGKPVKVSGSIVRRAMQESRAILTAEAASDMRFREQRSVVINRIGPVLCAPLVSHLHVRGAIYLAKKFGAPRFNEDDLDLLAAIGMQAGIALENVLIHEQRKISILQMVRSLVAIMELREPETKGHAERVAAYSLAIAKQMGLPEEECLRIQLSALLHDIGKIALRPAPQTPARAEEEGGVRIPAEHVLLGERLLDRVPVMSEFAVGARFHHERMDGSGFPRGSQGEEIPMPGRIIMVTNWYDNLTTTGGIGRQGLPPKEVLKELQAMSGTQFDAHVAKALILVYRQGALHAPETLYDSGWTDAVKP
jgi:HD-GYP domain-containing protein (c-di-GMP phosphodiesterase class II)